MNSENRDFIHGDIAQLTLDNEYFRRVISTSDEMQLVLMSIDPLDEIGLEVHLNVTQFFRIEAGEGILQIDYGNGLQNMIIRDNSGIFVPAGSPHNIINTSKTNKVKLYTIYAPPNHKHGKINITNPRKMHI
jgi:mannose-6-phosphate isomerase-like protein (cupin superfamily)